MKKAADFKLVNLLNVYKIFNADLIIPFASFVYFSNSENFHLNKYMNNVETTSNYLENNNINHCILNPDFDEINIEKLLNNKSKRLEMTKKSINFWDNKIRDIKIKNEINKIHEISEDIKKSFLLRIKKANSLFLLFLIRFLSFKYFFGDVVIHLKDTNETYSLNFFKIIKNNDFSKSKIDIEMMSKRFFFLLKYPYGIDTISSNGCFLENLRVEREKSFRFHILFVLSHDIVLENTF